MRWLNNSRVGGFISMTAGGGLANLATLVALPVISRTFSPAEFGAFSLVIAISNVASPALALRYDQAILLPKSKDQASVLVTTSLLISLVTSALWGMLADPLSQSLFTGPVVPLLGWWVFGICFLTGIFNVLSQVAVRERKYRAIAVRSMSQGIATAGAQIAFGLYPVVKSGLLWGQLIGRTVGIVGLLRVARPYVRRPSVSNGWLMLRNYWKFPILFAPSSILNALGLQLPLIVLVARHGVEFGGELGMAERIVGVPIALLGGAMGQVFAGELAQMKRDGKRDYVSLFLRVSLLLTGLSIAVFGTAAIFADWVFPRVLGQEWAGSAALFIALAATGTVRLVASPISGAFYVFGRAGANIFIDVLRVIVVGGLLVASERFDLSPLTSVWLVYGGLAIIYLVTWVWVFGVLRNESVVSSKNETDEVD